MNSQRTINPENIVKVSPVRTLRWNTPTKIATTVLLASQIPRALDRFTNLTTGAQEHIPDVLYVPSHIGNTAMTFVIGSLFLNGYWGKNTELMPLGEFEKQKRKAIIAATIGAIALNTAAELIGYGPTSTPDKYDFIYGLAGAAIAYSGTLPFVSQVTDEIELESIYRHDKEERTQKAGGSKRKKLNRKKQSKNSRKRNR